MMGFAIWVFGWVFVRFSLCCKVGDYRGYGVSMGDGYLLVGFRVSVYGVVHWVCDV